jgi:hypothetical protein
VSLPRASADAVVLRIIFYVEKRKTAIQNIGVPNIVGTFKCFFKGLSYKGYYILYNFLFLGELNI